MPRRPNRDKQVNRAERRAAKQAQKTFEWMLGELYAIYDIEQLWDGSADSGSEQDAATLRGLPKFNLLSRQGVPTNKEGLHVQQ